MSLEIKEREWWTRPEDDIEAEDPRAHERLASVLSHLEREQSYRKRAHVLHAAMYGNNNVIQYDSRTRQGQGSNLSLNVSRNMVDAVTSRIMSKSKPALAYVTEGGDYERQKQAGDLERGVAGVFYNEGFYAKATLAGRDGCALGTSFLRIEPDHDEGHVSIGRWKPWEVILDDGESLYQGGGEKTDMDAWKSFYTVRYYDKWELAYRYRDEEEKRKDILRIDDTYDDDVEFGRQSAAVRVRVQEAWHRPSGRKADDGRHVIGVKNCTLLDEPWRPEELQHPFVPFLWSDPVSGTFYGQGLIEILMGMQTELNKLVREVQNGHHLICGHWLVERGSKVVLAHINNDLSRILQYTGTKPEYETPPIIAPEVYQHMIWLMGVMYEIAGINQQTSAAQIPQQIKSGEAQRVYADQQTETLLEKGQRFEQFVLACGTKAAGAARLLAKRGAYEVRAMADDAFSTIDWKKLEDPDGFEARIAPVSSLPGTPSGKIDLANDLQKLGEFDAGDVLEVVGMPDILQITKRKQSSRKRTEMVVGRMLREGISYEPDEFFKLREAAIIARDMLCEAETKEDPPVDDGRLQLVRDFIVKAILLAKQLESQGNPLQPTPAPTPGPPGQPAQPPQPAQVTAPQAGQQQQEAA
jgi:hypothetical protein